MQVQREVRNARSKRHTVSPSTISSTCGSTRTMVRGSTDKPAARPAPEGMLRFFVRVGA
jgi:hypothetical protein